MTCNINCHYQILL